MPFNRLLEEDLSGKNLNYELIERLVEERDRLYLDKFQSIDNKIALLREIYDRTVESITASNEAEFKAAENYRSMIQKMVEDRFSSNQIAVKTAFIAQEKLFSVQTASADKAIAKAEQAQKEYNERSNEFRGQLDDQAKTLMPRPETLGMFRMFEEKLAAMKTSTDLQIANLREWKSEGGGREMQKLANISQYHWIINLLVALVFGALGYFVHRS